MSKMISPLINASILVTFFTLYGCSSGGDAGVAAPLYSGSTTPAAITQANADDIAQKSTEGFNEAVNMARTGEGIPFAVEVNSASDAIAQKIGNIALEALNGAVNVNLPAAAVLTADDLNAGSPSPMFCGGSITVPDNVDPNASTFNFSMTFNSLCYNDGVTSLLMSGSLTFVKTDTSVSITFSRFSATIDGNQETFSGTFSCDEFMNNCTLSTDYAGTDGNVYRIADVVINGDNSIGYTVNATFYHNALGRVSLATTSPVTYGGCGIYPSGGVVTVSSSDGSNITITFSGCDYSITGVDANTVSILVNGSWT